MKQADVFCQKLSAYDNRVSAMPESIFSSYKRLQERFGLPHLQKLQTTFQLDIEPECNLDEIRSEISNKLFEFTEHAIEPLLWSGHHCHIMEREMLNPEEGERIFELYKEIQALKWRNNLLSIRRNPEETAVWIHDLWMFWRRFEIFATDLCLKFSDGWKTLRFKEIKPEYQG
jgi:hypothetical protein